MADEFNYDVFLSHSVKDKPIVRELAERLRKDGLKVWLDEWVLKPGDHVQAKIEEGLEQSRVLVLCMSANAFGSDWAQLEAGTFRFRDPLNRERRFIPLRLDAAPIKGSLAQFLYINWLPEAREKEYVTLLEACRIQSQPLEKTLSEVPEQLAKRIIHLNHSEDVLAYQFSHSRERVLISGGNHSLGLWDLEKGNYLKGFFAGDIHDFADRFKNNGWSLAWSPNEQLALIGSSDHSIKLCDIQTGKLLNILDGHRGQVWAVAWCSDQRRAVSGSGDRTVCIWDISTGQCLKVLKGHDNKVFSVAWSSDQSLVLSGSADKTLRIWDTNDWHCVRILEGHTDHVIGVTLSFDDRLVISTSSDKTSRIWDVQSGHCLITLEGHTDTVTSAAWRSDQRYALTCSRDKTACLWDVATGACLIRLVGHKNEIISVKWDYDQLHAFTGDIDGCIHVWDLSPFLPKTRSLLEVFGIAEEIPQTQYTNAKVLLVGDSGVGKTGLANRLVLDHFEETDSTDGAWATQWELLPRSMSSLFELSQGVIREIWLWDFAGQVDYRLVHQLYMDDTAAAVLVFNPQNENLFEGLGQWDRDMQKATRMPFAKLLAAGRIDRGGLVVSDASILKFIAERGFRSPLHLTSAKTGEGCDALRDAIIAAIDWQNIPETTSPALYHRMKQEILHLRDRGLVLIRLAELKQRMEMALLGERFELAELQTVVGLLAGPGMIQHVDFGGFILLRPEVLSRYAAAVVRRVRKHPQELGCIREDELLGGELDYQDFERLPSDDEKVILRALLETFVSRAWCLRQPHGNTALLTFPSYFRRERKEQPGHPNVLVTYRFSGHVEDLYATLVVRLHHTEAFEADALWKDAADFKTQTGQSLGLKLVREAEGAARLEVYFNPDVDENSRLVFLRYVHNHLTEHAQDVARLRHYCCGNRKCDSHNQPFTDQAKIDRALAGGKDKVFCPDCGKAILLRDVMEQKFDSTAVKEQARQLQVESQIVIDNESRELILVGHAFTITAEAGQIYRGYTNSDHGIDGEIEFKDDQGRATGKRLYLQLKSGDSYLITRKRDGAEVFQIKNERWAQYWQQQAYPVLLVIRTSDGEIRWMDVSEYLKRVQQPAKQIVFAGERFDVMSVRRWRDIALRGLLR